MQTSEDVSSNLAFSFMYFVTVTQTAQVAWGIWIVLAGQLGQLR